MIDKLVLDQVMERESQATKKKNMIFKNNITIHYMNKEIKSIHKIIKALNKINRTLWNKIEDESKKNHDIMLDLEKLQNLYKDILTTIK